MIDEKIMRGTCGRGVGALGRCGQHGLGGADGKPLEWLARERGSGFDRR